MNNELAEVPESDTEEMLYARHAEITSWADLEKQRGTPIPAIFSQFYKFIQNPSTVSVETYKRMIDTDDTLGSGIDFLTTCLVSRIGRYEHPVKEIEDWVNKALEAIAGGFRNAMKELLGASWAGFMIQEKVWGNDEHLGFVIKRLVTLPPTSILFETERTGELTPDGILQYQRNYNPASMSAGAGSMFGFLSTPMSPGNDPYARFGDMPFPIRTGNTYAYLSVRIPVEKCIHYSFDASGKLGNPYGRSLLRRAYKWYVMKDGFLQMLSVALDRKGTPLTIVYADPNTTLADPDRLTPNARGTHAKGIRADVAAARAFANVHADSTIILPGKKGQIYDTDFVDQASNANDFISAIDLCNKSMLRALLIPSLIFTNGDGTGSFALGQEHARTFEKILDGMLDGFLETIRSQVVKQLLQYNWPKDSWSKHGIGSFAKAEVSPEQISREIEWLEKAVNIGAADTSDLQDLNAIRDKIGLPPRTEVFQHSFGVMESLGLDDEERELLDNQEPDPVQDNAPPPDQGNKKRRPRE